MGKGSGQGLAFHAIALQQCQRKANHDDRPCSMGWARAGPDSRRKQPVWASWRDSSRAPRGAIRRTLCQNAGGAAAEMMHDGRSAASVVLHDQSQASAELSELSGFRLSGSHSRPRFGCSRRRSFATFPGSGLAVEHSLAEGTTISRLLMSPRISAAVTHRRPLSCPHGRWALRSARRTSSSSAWR